MFFNLFMFEDLSFMTMSMIYSKEGNFRKSQISENIMDPESKTNWSESLLWKRLACDDIGFKKAWQERI